MQKSNLYLKHIFASFILLALLVNTIFLLYGQIKFLWSNLEKYFKTSFSLYEMQFIVFYITLVVIAVLISYIFYLLLTFKTRFEFQIGSATRSIAESKEQFRKLYESAPVPYLLLDKNGGIKEPNKSALRFFGVFPEDILDKNLFSFVSPENIEQGEKLFQYYKSKIPINRKEVQMVTKTGSVKTVLLSIFKMENAGNSLSTGLAMIFDITEQKLLDKQKTEFVSLASHQLRTPLATAKWYTEMLISGDIGDLSEKQKDYVNRLQTANNEMIELVDVLLNVSRIEMGTLAVDEKDTNIEDLTNSVLDELNINIESKSLKIEKQYKGFLKNVKTDPKLLRIVIQNLLSNAVKYTPNNGTVAVMFEDSLINGKEIIISDTGVGIPKDAQDKIFTKLFRADNVRGLENSQGTGLGLYLVKSIMLSIGGTIGFRSEENRGSVFTIKL